MATLFNHGDQIVTLSAGDEIAQDRMAVDSIILRGTAAGVFVITVGTTAMSINNSANALTVQLNLNRSTNYLELVSGPANAVMYVLLEKKR